MALWCLIQNIFQKPALHTIVYILNWTKVSPTLLVKAAKSETAGDKFLNIKSKTQTAGGQIIPKYPKYLNYKKYL